MFKKITIASLAALLCAAADLPLLERFDATDAVNGNLLNGAAIDTAAGLDKGALKAEGNGQGNRVLYTTRLPLTGGNSYAMSLNYRTSKINNYSFRVDVVYEGVKGKNQSYNMIASNVRWMQKTFDFTAPEGTTSATVRMRLVRAAAGSSLLVDNFRIEQVTEGTANTVHLTEFATDFNEWSLDKHPVLDHFMPGPGGSIVKDPAGAKSGDSYFKAIGNGTAMQYALYIDNIKMQGGANYVFEGSLKATDAFRHNANGMLIFFFKDANGTAVGQSRFHIRNTGDEWKDIKHQFAVPANCAWLDIGLNMRDRKENDIIQFDRISLKRQ